MLLFIVNDVNIDVEEIHLKFFEPAHTFMASDAAHGRIEQMMRKTKKVFDFRDFVEITRKAKCHPLEMEYSDFRYWKSGASQHALKQLGDNRPYMKEIVSARFVMGSEELKYKKQFNAQEISVRFLKNNFDLIESRGEVRTKPRGMETKKKMEIVEKLVPLMPANRQSFWINLPEDKKGEDLAEHF